MHLPKKDQVEAALRHVYTAVGAVVAALVVLDVLGQTEADRIVEIANTVGGTVATIIGVVAALLPVINALRAASTASDAAQIRKVEKIAGVEVKPVNAQGAELVKTATGAEKPVIEVKPRA